MSIFHRMRNVPFAICVVQHLECQLNWIRLIRISYLGWVKFHSFSSSWLNIASARPTHNAYFIHKTVLVRDKIAQIHTNTQRKVIVTSCTPAEWYETARLCNGTILLGFVQLVLSSFQSHPLSPSVSRPIINSIWSN